RRVFHDCADTGLERCSLVRWREGHCRDVSVELRALANVDVPGTNDCAAVVTKPASLYIDGRDGDRRACVVDVYVREIEVSGAEDEARESNAVPVRSKARGAISHCETRQGDGPRAHSFKHRCYPMSVERDPAGAVDGGAGDQRMGAGDPNHASLRMAV